MHCIWIIRLMSVGVVLTFESHMQGGLQVRTASLDVNCLYSSYSSHSVCRSRFHKFIYLYGEKYNVKTMLISMLINAPSNSGIKET